MELNQVVWFTKRLSRISPGEFPYRCAMLCRILIQRLGFRGAHPIPEIAQDSRFGLPWVKAPDLIPHTDQLVRAADELLAGELSVFGHKVTTANGIPDWNRDPVTGTKIPMRFGHAIDFRHLRGGVDIKFLWEVNRHHWWVTLAQAYAVTSDSRYLDRLGSLIADWLQRCPYPLGANWSSPVEHGIRLINWSIVWALIGGRHSLLFEGEAGQTLLSRWLDGIYEHIRFASDNYSRYSSADNHLIGEAAGVYVGASTWDCWEDVRRLRQLSKEILEQEIQKQFAEDGVNLEQAFCYQRFSMEFLLASGLCAIQNDDDFSPVFWRRLKAAFIFVAAMTSCTGAGATYGDSDDGSVFNLGYIGEAHPVQSLIHSGRRLFGTTALVDKSLALEDAVGGDERAGWLVYPLAPILPDEHSSPQLPTSFLQGGYVLLGERLHREDELRVLFDVGPLGYNRVAGHGHADALSIVLSCHGRDILIDPGTYAYNGAPEWRKYFRGTRAHNTVLVDSQEQSVYGGSFLWLRDVNTTLHSLTDNGTTIEVVASHNGYGRLRDPVVHVRRLRLERSTRELLVQDWLECKASHDVMLLWHFAPNCALQLAAGVVGVEESESRLEVSLPEGGRGSRVFKGAMAPPFGWTSRRFYHRTESPTLVQQLRAAPGQVLETRLALVGDR